jgi:hypothetical protein
MRELRYTRERHRSVEAALAALDGAFLSSAACCFAGGTRIVLELGEYRESEDLDFLCADGMGYRLLRSTVTQASLGQITRSPLRLAREVRADRYGIRTVLEMKGSMLKFEVVFEGRVPIAAESVAGTAVPCLDRVSCFGEKFLANADRGADDESSGRDIIDLAFMIDAWGIDLAAKGLAVARNAYGEVVVEAAGQAAARMLANVAWRRRCIERLALSNVPRLMAGLGALARTS